MRNVHIMIKPVSSLCNMKCKYCFYADVVSHRDISSYGFMKWETTKKVIQNSLADLEANDVLTFSFQGGEPTLAGLTFFENFVRYVNVMKKNISVNYSLQTNASLLDDKWCAFFRENRFLLGVSLDGPAQINDYYRVDANGNGTYRTTISAINLLRKYGVEFNILLTLTKSLSRHPFQIWNFIEEHDFRYVQFTPCLAPLDSTENNAYAITPQHFADFYIKIFGQWEKKFKKGKYYSIKLFDDLINLLAVGEINSCGLTGQCQSQLIVEADGRVFPCDFYSLDQWCIGSLCESTITELLKSEVNFAFLSRERELPLCNSCPHKYICNGACERMQKQICYSKDDNTCGYRKFLDATIDSLLVLAHQELKARKNIW